LANLNSIAILPEAKSAVSSRSRWIERENEALAHARTPPSPPHQGLTTPSPALLVRDVPALAALGFKPGLPMAVLGMDVLGLSRLVLAFEAGAIYVQRP
jgi:hypothetical protein